MAYSLLFEMSNPISNSETHRLFRRYMASQAKLKSEAKRIIQRGDHSAPFAAPKRHMLRKKPSDQKREHAHSGAAPIGSVQTEAEDRNPIWGNDKPRSMKEIAALAGMRLGTLRQKVYRREIESVLVGRERQIQPSAMRVYFERQKRPAL